MLMQHHATSCQHQVPLHNLCARSAAVIWSSGLNALFDMRCMHICLSGCHSSLAGCHSSLDIPVRQVDNIIENTTPVGDHGGTPLMVQLQQQPRESQQTDSIHLVAAGST